MIRERLLPLQETFQPRTRRILFRTFLAFAVLAPTLAQVTAEPASATPRIDPPFVCFDGDIPVFLANDGCPPGLEPKRAFVDLPEIRGKIGETGFDTFKGGLPRGFRAVQVLGSPEGRSLP